MLKTTAKFIFKVQKPHSSFKFIQIQKQCNIFHRITTYIVPAILKV